MKNQKELQLISNSRRTLIFREYAWCSFWSIVLGALITFLSVAMSKSKNITLIAISFVTLTVVSFIFYFSLRYKSKIMEIKNSIWEFTKENVISKLEKAEKRNERRRKVVDWIWKVLRLDRQISKWQNKIYQIRMNEPSI
jgi:uncharacterized membrane protein YcgQ (UPF0703/DUF1980 family)